MVANKKIRYASTSIGPEEKQLVQEVLNSSYISSGIYIRRFEHELAAYLNVKYAVATNSGSSANLLAIAALDLPPGSGVITPALTFPTSFNPILQHNHIPVVVDCSITTWNANLLAGLDYVDCRAAIIPHMLGNPFNWGAAQQLTVRGIPIIEDCCDAIGATWQGKKVGSLGLMGTFSFYPAHHITMGGEGGAVVTNDDELYKKLKSLRDWGRECWCDGLSTKDGMCQKRYTCKVDNFEYDHRYVYSNVGYNLKPTDIQAAIGIAQLHRLQHFVKQRNSNHQQLIKIINKTAFQTVNSYPEAKPSWFALPLMVPGGGNRKQVVQFLEKNGIECRYIFAGNILRQPAYQRHLYRVCAMEALTNTDRIMRDAFFIGVHQNLTKNDLAYMGEILTKCSQQFLEASQQ